MSTVDRVWGLTVYATLAEIAGRPGPLGSFRYAYVVETAAAYRWVLGSAITADQINVITPDGGGVGQWLQIRDTSQGALTDASVTTTIAAGRWRYLAAATLTADRILTLGTACAALGDEITVTRLDTTAWTYTVRNGGAGGGDVVLPAAKRSCVVKRFDGTNWVTKQSGEML